MKTAERDFKADSTASTAGWFRVGRDFVRLTPFHPDLGLVAANFSMSYPSIF
jgi:hypothetical protein